MGTERDDEDGRGRKVAGAAGAVGAAGAAVTGAQALLGMDVAEAAVDEGSSSAIPLGDVQGTETDVVVDVDADVDAFLDEDAAVLATGAVDAVDPLADLDDGLDVGEDLLALDGAGPEDLDLDLGAADADADDLDLDL